MSKVMLRKISANVKSNIKCKRKVKYVLLSKISTKVKSTIECKCKVLFTIKCKCKVKYCSVKISTKVKNASIKNNSTFYYLIHLCGFTLIHQRGNS